MRSTPPDDPFKKGKAGESDDEAKKIEKLREVDPEEKRKKFQRHMKPEKKEPDKKETTVQHTPYDSKFHTTPHDLSKSKEKETDADKKSVSFEKTTTKPTTQKEIASDEQDIDLDYTVAKHPKKEAKEVKTTTYLPPKPHERVEQQNFEKKHKKIPEGPPEEKNEPKEIKAIPIPAELPVDIAQRASEITADLTVYLNPEIAPLFEQMVGQMVIMSTQEGIVQTEVELTSDSFKDSVFYGSKITLEKYATAPDSFNIQLTGSTEAVAIFQASLEPLMESFRKANLNFRIGRLEAVHEVSRPLFRRKKPPTNEGETKGFR